MKAQKTKKPVASDDGIIAKEELPLPVVHYPGFYGAFFGFSEGYGSNIFLCACARDAVERYIQLQELSDNKENSDPNKAFVLSSKHFPASLVAPLRENGCSRRAEALEHITFLSGLCHECNRKTPSYAYYVPMYATVFEQNYGWYINKESYRCGVEPVTFRVLSDVVTEEIFSESALDKDGFSEKYASASDSELVLLQARDSQFQKQTRRMRKIIENEVRARFGFKKVGDAWANETLLYELICQYFPEERVLRHYRPWWLENLELDIYIPRVRIGIEYQGIQHFKPVKHWGGESALAKTQERDIRKADLCRMQNVELIYFSYTDEVSEKTVKEKLAKFC